MAQHEPLTITHAGRTWRATYEVKDGEVAVSSAYGSARGKVGRRQPKIVAEDVFSKILREAR